VAVTISNPIVGQGSIVIATSSPPQLDDDGNPDIPYAWAVTALQHAGMSKIITAFGVATADEQQEFTLLNQWKTT